MMYKMYKMNDVQNKREGIQFVITLQPILAEQKISCLCISLKFVEKLKKQHQQKCINPSKEPKPKWQSEFKYNRLLPYYDQLSKEADKHLAAIKTGLGYTILLRNSYLGLQRWLVELINYIDLNGYRFTKEDHILFVKISYQLFCNTNSELFARIDCGCMLIKLLAKPKLLDRCDIEFDWKPFYEVYETAKFKNKEKIGPRAVNSQYVENIILACRIYFPVSAVKEIVEHVRPLLCPGDMAFSKGLEILKIFLPVDFPAVYHDDYLKAYIDELLYWLKHSTTSDFHLILEILMALPVEARFWINEDKLLPYLFTKLFRAFQLPLSGGTLEKINGSHFSCLLLTFFGGDNKVQPYLTQLFESLQSYIHPSNIGPWQYNVLYFILLLVINVSRQVHVQRHHRRTWRSSSPELYLTDKQIDEFVSSVLPCALNGMFDSQYAELAEQCLHYLSNLSPRLVIPEVVSKLFDALENSLEPNRLIQSLSGVIAVLYQMIRETGEHSSRKHVIPLMIGLLPALDINDPIKCSVTVYMFNIIFCLVPVVDCSEAIKIRSDLTAEEKEICISTALFENFINQFLDKIFSIVETLGSANGMNPDSDTTNEESSVMGNIYTCVKSLFSNCSLEFYELAIDRMYRYIEVNSFERTAAAYFLGRICAEIISNRPKRTFGRFLKLLFAKLKYHITEEMYTDETTGCSDVVWYLCVCNTLVDFNSNILTTEKETIMDLLSLVIGLKPKRISDELADIVFALLRKLTKLYIIDEIDEKNFELDKPFSQCMPIRLWAKTCALEETNFKWHIMSDNEFEMAKEIFDIFLIQQLTKFENPDKMSREDIMKSIIYIQNCFCGIAYLLPPLDGNPIYSTNYDIGKFSDFKCVSSVDKRTFTVDGQNFRNFLFEKLHRIMDYIIKSRSSESKSLWYICRIYCDLIFHKGIDETTADSEKGVYNLIKMRTTDVIVGRRSYPKVLHMLKTTKLHRQRLLYKKSNVFNETHKLIMDDLLKLCGSQYEEVRCEAQATFSCVLKSFNNSCDLFIDDILAILKPESEGFLTHLKPSSNITDEQRKGALYLISCANGGGYILDEWTNWCKVWPAVIQAHHCQDEQLVCYLEYIRLQLLDKIAPYEITYRYSNELIELSKQLWHKTEELSVHPLKCIPTELEQLEAVCLENKRNENNKKKYYELLDILVKLCNDKTMHWRHLNMANGFLWQTIRVDMPLPTEAVQIFVFLLVNDSIYMRIQALGALSLIMKLWKVKAEKQLVDVEKLLKINGYSGPMCLASDEWPIKFGYRSDNQWLIYQPDKVPNTESDWNKFVFVDKTYHGFYCWPNKVKACIPVNEQMTNVVVGSNETLNLEKTPLFESFNDKNFVQKFSTLMILNRTGENENADKEDENDGEFYSTELSFFEGLFRTYNDMFLDNFKEIIEQYIQSKDVLAEQRFVSVFIAGLVKGSKYWSFVKLQQLWSWLGPLMRSALETTLPDSLSCWSDCLQAIFGDRDPSRVFWLVEILCKLIESPKADSPAVTSNRIKLVMELVYEQQWRAAEINKIILLNIKPLLVQPYENLRQELGRCLAKNFLYNFPDIIRQSKIAPPNLMEFLDEVWDRLLPLREECEFGYRLEKTENENRKDAILLFKTILCFFRAKRLHAIYQFEPFIWLRFLPLISYCQNETEDQQLQFDCQHELVNGIGRCLLDPTQIYQVLQTCVEWSNTIWWKSRISLLEFLQVSVLSNFFSYGVPAHQKVVQQLIIKFIQDDRLEVREQAMDTLTCLLHFHYLPTDDSLVHFFQRWISTDSSKTLKHAGILGLAAIVSSCPYTVPNILPEVLMLLCQHKFDSPIIKVTVEKTLLDFKRTHLDSWHEHKERFTDDQLFVLTELLVSPTYYV